MVLYSAVSHEDYVSIQNHSNPLISSPPFGQNVRERNVTVTVVDDNRYFCICLPVYISTLSLCLVFLISVLLFLLFLFLLYKLILYASTHFHPTLSLYPVLSYVFNQLSSFSLLFAQILSYPQFLSFLLFLLLYTRFEYDEVFFLTLASHNGRQDVSPSVVMITIKDDDCEGVREWLRMSFEDVDFVYVKIRIKMYISNFSKEQCCGIL